MQSPHDIGPLCVVTGGAGFLGRSIVKYLLDQGYRVRVFDRAGHPDLDPRAELFLGDVRNRDEVRRAFAGAGTVFHTASIIYLAGVASAKTRRQVFDVNVGGTQNVIDACLECGVPRLVHTSTNNVVFDRELVDSDERAAYAKRWIDLYTETKMLSERAVLAEGRRGKLRTCALRPGGIWAPYGGGVMIDKVLDQIAQGTLIARIGAGGLADNTHVENLCEAELLAARALLEKPELVSGEAYFITDGEPMDPVDWFAPLVEGLGAKLPTRRLPASVMYGLGYACEWAARWGKKAPLLTRVEVLKVTRRHSFRIDKAREHLGYTPRIQSREGLLECLPYAREYLAKKRARG
ncbi:MAG: NAD-dependent epimerase/dehydratase family protein [Myxococcales bacterium]